MRTVPRDRAPDSTLALAVEGYRFVANRVRRYGSEVVETRLGLRPTTLLVGEQAARLLYDPTRFCRHGAMPLPVQQTLLGVGGVQGLDGEAHLARKQMFLSFLDPERSREFAAGTVSDWHAAAARWERAESVVLLDEVAELLCRAVCEWSGVPLPEHEVEPRTRDLRALIEDGGDPRLGYVRSRLARRRAEAWCAGLLEDVRANRLRPENGTALHTIATYRDLEGNLLDPHVAAVELLNVLRPTVAIHRYIVFAALALHQHPEWREALRHNDDDVLPFVQEVRRFYPFFPMVAAVARRPFRWRGVDFPEGRRVLLDLFATDHDPRTWLQPEEFRPERFRDWEGNAYAFIPQGGGDPATGHRCAGEWLTIQTMATAVRFLTRNLDYEVPAQDLRVSLRRMPTGPRSGFVIESVRRRGLSPEE